MKIERPGIFLDFGTASYHGDPCPAPSLTQSVAKVLIERSPAHARLEHPRLNPAWLPGDAEGYDAARAIGNAAHAYMLGRGKEIEVMKFTNFRTKEAQDIRDAAFDAGRVPILPHHDERARAMVEAARAQLAGTEIEGEFREGASEVVVAWQEGGLWFRAMIDWLSVPEAPLYVFDYKSTGMCCAPHLVAERPGELGWDVQAAMHERGLDALFPETAGRRKHFYINQENEPPYALVNVQISEADLTLGRKKLAYAIDVWGQCMASGKWPLYPVDTVLSRPRGYRETQWLDREIEHEERRSREPMLTSLAGE